MRERVASLEQRFASVVDRFDVVKDGFAEIRTDSAVLGEKLDQATKGIEDLRDSVKQLTASLQTAMERFSLAEQANSTARSEIIVLKKDVAELQALKWKLIGFSSGMGLAGGTAAFAALKALFGGV